MRISDWSSDVCSSDLSAAATNSTPSKPVASWTACCSRGADRRAETSGGRPRADALHGRWARLLYHDILIGDDLQVAETGAQQLAFFEQECRRSEEHTSELQSLMRSSYAVFCLKKK